MAKITPGESPFHASLESTHHVLTGGERLQWDGGPGFLIRFRDPTLDGVALLVSGGSGHYHFALTAGGWPTGVSLDSTTGALVGTPTEFYDPATITASGIWPYFLKPYPFTVVVTDTVITSLPPLVINYHVGYYMRVKLSGSLASIPSGMMDGYHGITPLYSLLGGFSDVIIGVGEHRNPDSDPTIPILPMLSGLAFNYSMIRPSTGGTGGGASLAWNGSAWAAIADENGWINYVAVTEINPPGPYNVDEIYSSSPLASPLVAGSATMLNINMESVPDLNGSHYSPPVDFTLGAYSGTMTWS